MYDHVHTSQILLYNSGKVDLDYCVLGAIDSTLHAPTPGSLSVHPPMGHIPALGEQIITITFLPGTPSVFEKSLHIQVAHFEPDIITVTGEAVFPRIAFDIQRDLSQVSEAVIEEAKTNLSSIEGESGVQELEAEVERLLVRGYAQDQTTKAQKKSFRYMYVHTGTYVQLYKMSLHFTHNTKYYNYVMVSILHSMFHVSFKSRSRSSTLIYSCL